MTSNRSLLRWAAALVLCGIPCTALAVSSNPDTPTTLRVNTIIGHMTGGDGKTFDNYYTFQAGPGTVKVRVTLRAGGNAGDVEVGLSDPDGNQLVPATCGEDCNANNVIATGQGDRITTGTFVLNAKKTLVMHVKERPTYYRAGRPSYRITLDGAVALSKTAKPLVVDNR